MLYWRTSASDVDNSRISVLFSRSAEVFPNAQKIYSYLVILNMMRHEPSFSELSGAWGICSLESVWISPHITIRKESKKHEESLPNDALDVVDAAVAVVAENFSAIIINWISGSPTSSTCEVDDRQKSHFQYQNLTTSWSVAVIDFFSQDWFVLSRPGLTVCV